MTTQGHINTFSQGMDKDTASQKYSNLKYEHAENLRLLTDNGLSTGAMVNIEGNEKLVSFPNLVRVKKRGFGNTISTGGFTLHYADGTSTSNSVQINSGDSVAPLADAINNNLEFSSLTAYIGSSSNASGDPYDFTIVSGSNNVTGIGNAGVTTDANYAGHSFEIISNYYILGSTTVRDSIIIFTTDNQTTIGGDGQIWKVDYDDSTLATTVSLIYTGELNFSTKYLIEAVGRYETSNAQNIYWTDNYNSVRSIRITDPLRFTIKPELLALTAEVTVVPGKFTNIGEKNSGLLDVGTYQVSYRLQTRSGTTTAIAPWSVPISINAADESVEHWNYQRADHEASFSKANKTLTFAVEDIAEGYDYLEIFLLRRGVSEGILYKVDTVTLGENTSIQYKITGTEGEFEEIFQDEIENFNIVFDTAKTITIKDNRLLIGNITEKSQYVDYDAKAYRYKLSDNNSTYKDEVNNPDAINPFNKDSTMFDSVDVSRSTSLYRYTHNSGNNFGGTGDNISYEFTTKDIELDNKRVDADATYDNYPMVDIRKNIVSTNINGVDYSFDGKLWNNYRNPFLEHLMAGYQRGEVYRFGVLFYDLYSRPMDVKWIGDIRMPEHYDSDNNSVYDTTYTNTNGELIGRVLGLNFNIDISGIDDKISGFSIVRAPRPNKDKTILGQGVVGDVAKVSKSYFYLEDGGSSVKGEYANALDVGYARGVSGEDTWLEGEDEVLMPLSRLGAYSSARYNGVVTSPKIVTFDSPQMLNGFGDPLLYGNVIGDETQGISGSFTNIELKPVKGFTSINGYGDTLYNSYKITDESKEPNGPIHFNTAANFVTSSEVPMYMCKYYKSNLFKLDYRTSAASKDPVYNKIAVTGGIRMNYFNDNFLLNTFTRTDLLNIVNNGKDYKFHNIELNSRTNSNSNSIILGLGSAFPIWYNKIYGTSAGDTGYYTGSVNTGHFAIRGQGKILANLYRENEGQYGGNTQLDIEKTTYISTGHYQKVVPGTTSYTAEVFGGDTFINVVNQIKNYPSEKLNTNGESAWSTVYPSLYNEVIVGSNRFYGAMTYPIETTVNMDMRFEKEYTDYIEEPEREARKEAEQYYINNTSGQPTSVAYPFAKTFTTADNFTIDHTYKERLSTDIGKFQAEDYSKTFFTLDSANIITSEFDNRVYASQVKINGEKTDSWKVFKLNNSLDVDGHYGPINKLEVLNEHVVFFQDRGLGVIAVNPRSVITDAGGAQLELGAGDVLHDFDYVSTEVGSKHQKGVQKSRGAIYFFDANSRKFYRFRGKSEPLSDMKGMSSHFYNTFTGDILKDDNMLIGAGFSTGFDPRYNEVMFTYKDRSGTSETTATEGSARFFDKNNRNQIRVIPDAALVASIEAGDDLYIKDFGGDTYILAPSPYSINTVTTIVDGDPVETDYLVLQLTGATPGLLSTTARSYSVQYKTTTKAYTRNLTETIVFSEAIDSFSGFYSFTPDHYINDGSRMMSRDSVSGDVYIHNEGTRCSFYGQAPAPSILRTIVNPKGTNNKVFNNIEYLAQLTDTTGADILDETFNSLKVYNEYQSVTKDIVTYGNPLLTLDQMHARRRMRNWRMAIPRSGVEKARIRNPYTTMEFTYNNNADKKLVLNDIITYYTDVPM